MLVLLASVVAVGCKKKPPEVPAAPLVVADAPARAAVETVAQAIAELRANFARVRFGTDSESLDEQSRRALIANAEILSRFGGLVVEIQGHADERGTTDYNLALGQRRAESVKGFLLTHGAGVGQLRTVSFGEERPLSAGSDTVPWSENRRAEFRVLVPVEGVQGSVQ